ncbi:MAG TPA: HEAT repeat domain-containing protein [Steroidobacteraceae bacterium]|nr:HEAT repeat domain-containing protein [Steroidobacteraceae bacterium]
MDLEERLRASLVAPDPGPEFTKRVMARLRRSSGRRNGRFMVVGGLLAMAAAAGMLAWQYFAPGQAQGEVTALPAAAGPVDPDVQRPASTVLRPEGQVASATEQAALPEQLPAQFSVLVLPLRQEVQDASLHRRVEAFQAALLEELRKVPGLTLRVSNQLVQGTGDEADYVLSLTSLATGAARSGGVAVLPTDGGNPITITGFTAGAAIGDERGAAASAAYGARAMTGVVGLATTNRLAGFSVEYGISDLAGGGGASFFFAGELGSLTGISAGGGIIDIRDVMRDDPRSVSWTEMRVTPRQSAASRYIFPLVAEDLPGQRAAAIVDRLRLQIFPPDAGYQQRLLERLSNAGGGGKELQDLLPLLATEGGKRLSPAALQALFRHVANQPASIRAKVWQTLGQSDSPMLLAPLLESLRGDPDEQVRLAALTNLESRHAGNPAFRSALESMEPGEPDPFVRAALRWALYGEAQWRADVLAALHDTGLSYEARLAPLVARTSADHSAQQSWQMSQLRRNLMQDEQVLRSTLELVGAHLRDWDQASLTTQALRLLGNIEHPAVTDLFQPLLGDTTLPIEVRGAASTWATNHLDEPRVREAMPQLPQTVPSALLERMKEVSGVEAGVIEVVPAQ